MREESRTGQPDEHCSNLNNKVRSNHPFAVSIDYLQLQRKNQDQGIVSRFDVLGAGGPTTLLYLNAWTRIYKGSSMIGVFKLQVGELTLLTPLILSPLLAYYSFWRDGRCLQLAFCKSAAKGDEGLLVF